MNDEPRENKQRHMNGLQKKGNRWYIIIELEADPVTRKRKRKWISTPPGTTKKEAEKERIKLLRERDTGVLIADPTKLTVAEYLRHWLDTYAVQNTNAKTQEGYRSILEQRVIPIVGWVRLAKLTGAHIREMETELLTKGRRIDESVRAAKPTKHEPKPLSARSVQHTHRVLSEALSHAVEWLMIPRNVADEAHPPRPEPKEMDAWNANEARQFLATVVPNEKEGVKHGTALALALTTGMRLGEVVGLRWQDVDLDRETIHVQQKVQRIHKRGLVAGQPKTARGRRPIKLLPGITDLLRAHKVEQNKVRLQLGPAYQDKGLVFATPLGTPTDPHNLELALDRAIEKAGVRRITFHGLRHTHATLLLKQNTHVKVVSERLGHATIAITLDVYSHVLPDMQDEAVRNLGRLLAAPPGDRPGRSAETR